MCVVSIFNVCIGYDSFDAYQSSKESDHVVLCFNDNDWDGIECIHARVPLMHREKWLEHWIEKLTFHHMNDISLTTIFYVFYHVLVSVPL